MMAKDPTTYLNHLTPLNQTTIKKTIKPTIQHLKMGQVSKSGQVACPTNVGKPRYALMTETVIWKFINTAIVY